MYGEKNPSRAFEIYECLFELKQGHRSVSELYGELKSLIDELEMHRTAVTDVVTLRGYFQDLTVSKFLSDLSLTLRSQIRGQILGGNSILTLTTTFSRVMWVLIGADVFSALSIEQSVMVSERGRGRCRSRDFGGRGRGFVGGGCGSYGDIYSAYEKGLRQCRHCGRSNHIYEK